MNLSTKDIPCAITILEDLNRTLPSPEYPGQVSEVITACIQELQRNGFIKITDEELNITPLPKIEQVTLPINPTLQ
jgi:hypothetical protein